jgi:hypothetical protein
MTGIISGTGVFIGSVGKCSPKPRGLLALSTCDQEIQEVMSVLRRPDADGGAANFAAGKTLEEDVVTKRDCSETGLFVRHGVVGLN